MYWQQLQAGVAMSQVSTAEAARIHGVTSQTIRRWITTGRLTGVRDNHGNIRVVLNIANDATHVASVANDVASVANSVASAATLPASSERTLADLLADFHRRFEDQETRHAVEMAHRLAERDALHREHLDRSNAQAATERALWLERIDAAELRAERIEQRLDQVLEELLADRSRPLWRRLFG